MAPTDIPMVPVKGQTGLAWVVALAVAAAGLFIIIVAAFSQDNTPTSIDGDRSVYSHHLDSDE